MAGLLFCLLFCWTRVVAAAAAGLQRVGKAVCAKHLPRPGDLL